LLVAPEESYEARRWPIDADHHFDPVDVLRDAIGNWATPKVNSPNSWVHARALRKFCRTGMP
jgi:hypothetical protein